MSIEKICTQAKQSDQRNQGIYIPSHVKHSGILAKWKKPPTAFISSRDWGLYLRVCCQLRHIRAQFKCTEEEAQQILFGGHTRRWNCIIRFIGSFNQLYGEYNRLLDVFCQEPNNAPMRSSKQQTNWNSNRRYLSPRFSVTCNSISTSGWGDSIEQDVNEKSAVTQATFQVFASNATHTLTPSLKHSRSEVTTKPVSTHCSSRIPNSASTTLCLASSAHTLNENSESSCRSNALLNYSGLPQVCFRWCYRPTRYHRLYRKHSKEALKLSKHLSLTYNQPKRKHYNKLLSNVGTPEYFDQLHREPKENSLIVYQIVNYSWRVEHRTELKMNVGSPYSKSEDQSSKNVLDVQFGGKHKTTTIRLPIALELVLPKTQKQLDHIMQNCPFICDPLEVAAELRQCNYDLKACIEYFHQTRPLRKIIYEMIPNKGRRDKRTLPIQNVNDNIIASVKSKHLNDVLAKLNELKRDQKEVSNRIKKLRTYTDEMCGRIKQLIETNMSSNLPNVKNWPVKVTPNSNNLSYAQLNKLTEENNCLKQTLRMEENRRKSMFNMMQEYLGNIRVYCRCRWIPQTRSCIEVPSIDTVVFTNGTDGGVEHYKFDRVFDQNSTQSEIYTELAPSVCSFLDGYNVCFLTYGGEASGKTYTLLGGASISESTDSHGIVQRALQTVLTERETRAKEWSYDITVAVIEIYNDNLIDLLGNVSGVHLHLDSGLDAMMDKLNLMRVERPKDIEYLLTVCNARRRVGRTALNAQSSRSHLIIFTRLTAHSRIHDTKLCSVLALCDLAGFEDIIKAETLGDPILAKEAGYINRSLTALNRVLMCLRMQDPNVVSYRDSKLTYLLKPFFTHSGKCILVVTVRSDKNNTASTQSTLRFGRESRGVSLGRARRQFNLDRLMCDMRAH